MATPQFIKRENMIADTEYIQWLSDIQKRFRQSQAKAAVRLNQSMLEFYWSFVYKESGNVLQNASVLRSLPLGTEGLQVS